MHQIYCRLSTKEETNAVAIPYSFFSCVAAGHTLAISMQITPGANNGPIFDVAYAALDELSGLNAATDGPPPPPQKPEEDAPPIAQ
jgi:hypothetical protein